MKTFKFIVSRTSYAQRETVVEAQDEDEAWQIALDTCGDFEYKEKDAEYDIQTVKEGK